MGMEKRYEQARWARKLQEILGSDYKVSYDTCESGMTDIYYKGRLFKSVRNKEMRHDLNVCDYRVDYNWMLANGISVF